MTRIYCLTWSSTLPLHFRARAENSALFGATSSWPAPPHPCTPTSSTITTEWTHCFFKGISFRRCANPNGWDWGRVSISVLVKSTRRFAWLVGFLDQFLRGHFRLLTEKLKCSVIVVFNFWWCSSACRILGPLREMKIWTWWWKCRVLTMGPKNSLTLNLFNKLSLADVLFLSSLPSFSSWVLYSVFLSKAIWLVVCKFRIFED